MQLTSTFEMICVHWIKFYLYSSILVQQEIFPQVPHLVLSRGLVLQITAFDSITENSVEINIAGDISIPQIRKMMISSNGQRVNRESIK